MNKSVQGLVAIACIAIIAGVSYYFYSQHAEAQAARRLSQQRAEEAFTASFYETLLKRQLCPSMKKAIARGATDDQIAHAAENGEKYLHDCRVRGYLN